VTLKEIAQMADVSITTVSRVLNNNDAKVASKEVREKIWRIASENGYSLSRGAKANRSHPQKNPDNGLEFLYCLCVRPYLESRDDTFYDELINGISSAAYKNNYILKHRFELQDLKGGLLDIVMTGETHRNLITMGRIEPALLDQLEQYFDHIVCISLNRMELASQNHYDQVLCDGFQACNSAMDYLYGLGHRTIGFIGQRKDSRLNGYLESLRRYGLPVDEDLIIDDAVLNMEGGRTSMQKLLRYTDRMTAVFCTSDRIAIGALSACNDNGVRVPKDISIIGMNDIEPAKFMSPPLTTIHVPLWEMGALAVHMLSDRLRSGRTLPVQVSVPYYIEERNSCCKCRSREDPAQHN